MYKLAQKLEKLSPYEAINGEYSIRLDANECCFDLPDFIREKICSGIASVSFNRYPDSSAHKAAEAFAGFYGIDSSYVTVGNGSDELISIIESCFLEKGGRILSFSPDFSMYRFYASLYELECDVIPKDADGGIDVGAVIEYCNDNNVAAVVFSNPCNPSSLGIAADKVKRLVSGVNCLVILDEAYMDFWGESLLDCVCDYDNLIVLKTCSKAVGMAAARIGFAVARPEITEKLKAAKSPYNTDTLAQLCAVVIFSEKKWLEERTQMLVDLTARLYSAISRLADEYSDLLDMPQRPKTNFVYISTDFADEIYTRLLKKSIAVRNFGSGLRITAGTEAENSALILALNEILNDIEKGKNNEKC